jgi:hypothetical protein
MALSYSELTPNIVSIKVCNAHSHKLSADFRSKRYGIAKEKGRAIADSTLAGFILKSHHSSTNYFFGMV